MCAVSTTGEMHGPLPGSAVFRLKDSDIREFQALVRDRCGVWITTEEATIRANGLMSLVGMIIGQHGQDECARAVRTSSDLSEMCEDRTLTP